jgi:hypothetical protein
MSTLADGSERDARKNCEPAGRLAIVVVDVVKLESAAEALGTDPGWSSDDEPPELITAGSAVSSAKRSGWNG